MSVFIVDLQVLFTSVFVLLYVIWIYNSNIHINTHLTKIHKNKHSE